MVSNEQILAQTQAIAPDLIHLRHRLHRHPELSGQETETAALVAETLQSWGIPVLRGEHTAVLGLIRGSRPGPVIGLRADMDALPIEEQSGEPFASVEPGRMHACGHDIHTAVLLGAAHVLSQNPDFAGTVKLCFQPAEEVGGGIEQLIELGMLSDPVPEAFLALHVQPDTPAGAVHARPGAMLCAASSFRVEFTGTGGHASQPERTQDTVLAAAKFITDAQLTAARRTPRSQPLTITVSTIHGGQPGRSNIIPKRVTLEGTIRTPERALHEKIHGYLRDILRSAELATGAQGEIFFRNGSNAVQNDAALTDCFLRGAAGLLGDEHVSVTPAPYMVSDNFARYGTFAPSVYFALGVSRPGSRENPSLHSPFFTADDSAIPVGTAALVRGALDILHHLEVRHESVF